MNLRVYTNANKQINQGEGKTLPYSNILINIKGLVIPGNHHLQNTKGIIDAGKNH